MTGEMTKWISVLQTDPLPPSIFACQKVALDQARIASSRSSICQMDSFCVCLCLFVSLFALCVNEGQGVHFQVANLFTTSL